MFWIYPQNKFMSIWIRMIGFDKLKEHSASVLVEENYLIYEQSDKLYIVGNGEWDDKWIRVLEEFEKVYRIN